MAESRRFVKVFLASPGDLADERKAAKLVVEEFNALLAEEFGYQVELVGWEDTVSVFGRPQATINKCGYNIEGFDRNLVDSSGRDNEFKIKRTFANCTPTQAIPTGLYFRFNFISLFNRLIFQYKIYST